MNQNPASWEVKNPFYDVQYGQQYPTNNKNFYDDMGSNGRTPRMGVGLLPGQKYRRPPLNQPPVRNAKGNPCSSERHAFYPNNLSTGSLSLNETKSSYDESINKSSEKADADISRKTESSDKNANESEPEWFSWPASRHDVIDLHGFDDDDQLRTTQSAEIAERPSSRGEPSKMFDDFARGNYRQERDPRRTNSNPQGRYYRNQNDGVGYGQQPQYRNTMNFPKGSTSTSNAPIKRMDNMNAIAAENINPFFEMWKRKQQHENVDFLNWVTSAASIAQISDIEKTMRQNQNQYANTRINAIQNQYGMSSAQQFFANASNSASMAGGAFLNPYAAQQQVQSLGLQSDYAYMQTRSDPLPPRMPTQEQLQQHTSEIMRNAVLRKKFQEDKKFPK